MNIDWTLETRLVADLKDHPKNPRYMTQRDREQLAAGIDRFGLIDKPVINTDGTIIGGHQRKQYLVDSGVPEVSCWVPSRKLTEAEVDELNIRLNRNQGRWDQDMLIEEFDLNDLMDWGFEEADFKFPHSVGFDEVEELDLPAIHEDSITQPGDIYDIGPHRLLCGDATDAGHMTKLMAGSAADLLITDPPYNVDYEGGTGKKLKIQNDAMSKAEFFAFLHASFSLAFMNCRNGSPAYVFHADSESIAFRQSFLEAGFKLSQCLIWAKNMAIIGRQDYHWQHEPILYGWKEGAKHPWHSDHRQSTILEFDRPMRNEDHPTMKPVSILTYLIRNSSRVDAIVLDNFGGSGSTLITCELIRRKARLMELDPRYCDATIRRYLNLCVVRKTSPVISRNGIPLSTEQMEEFTKPLVKAAP